MLTRAAVQETGNLPTPDLGLTVVAPIAEVRGQLCLPAPAAAAGWQQAGRALAFPWLWERAWSSSWGHVPAEGAIHPRFICTAN